MNPPKPNMNNPLTAIQLLGTRTMQRNIHRLAATYAITGLLVIVAATMLLAVFEAAAKGLTRLNRRQPFRHAQCPELVVGQS